MSQHVEERRAWSLTHRKWRTGTASFVSSLGRVCGAYCVHGWVGRVVGFEYY